MSKLEKKIAYILTCNWILGAVEEYEEVQRELSRISRAQTTENDAEKGAVEEFNLTEFLSGMSTEAQQAGTKPKHLGLIWKNLTVEVHFDFRPQQFFSVADVLSNTHII